MDPKSHLIESIKKGGALNKYIYINNYLYLYIHASVSLILLYSKTHTHIYRIQTFNTCKKHKTCAYRVFVPFFFRIIRLPSASRKYVFVFFIPASQNHLSCMRLNTHKHRLCQLFFPNEECFLEFFRIDIIFTSSFSTVASFTNRISSWTSKLKRGPGLRHKNVFFLALECGKV